MINFEVTHSNDPDFIGVHEYFMNKISLGRSKKNNIVIQNIQKLHLEIEVNETGELFCKSLAPDAYFILNGKKISGKKRLLPNDSITLGDLIFKIPSSSYTDDFNNRDVATLYKRAIGRDPRMKPIFKALEKEILSLSRKKDND